MEFVLLILSGFLIGTIGAIIGSGGGFLIVPLLLFTTDLSPQTIAGTSLATILFCTISGTIAYSRQAKIDYELGKILSVAMIPGAIIGVFLNQRINTHEYTQILGVVLLLISILLLRGFNFKIPHFIPNSLHM